MQPGNDGPDHAMIDVDTSPRRRKSSRLSGSSIASSEMVRSSRDAGEPAAALSSPRVLRKRASPSEDEFRPTGPARENHHMDSKPSHGSASTPPGEVLSGHFCLCQPQPKIPRPRNGEFALFFISGISSLKRRGVGSEQRRGFVCGHTDQALTLCSIYSLPTASPACDRLPPPCTHQS
jgi:hypothetical protein